MRAPLRGGWLCVLLATGCVTEPRSPAARPEVDVRAAAYDAKGRPASGKALGQQVWGLGAELPQEPPQPASQPSPQDTQSRPASGPQDPERRRQEEAFARTQFGPNIVIGTDGKITKQYFLSGEASSVFLALVAEPKAGQPAPGPGQIQPPAPGSRYGGSAAQSVLGRMLGDHEVELFFIRDFEQMESTDIVAKVTGLNPRPPPGATAANSLLLVTAKPSALLAFESALNLFYGSIPQIEIEVLVVEFNVTDSLNFGVVQTGANTPILSNLGADALVKSLTSNFPLDTPLIGSSNITDKGALVLGGTHNGWDLNAKIEALEVNNRADIKSSPKVVVRNGGVASVSTTTEYPFPKAKITSSGQNVTTDIDFKKVGITLNIRPVIAGTDIVILQVYADVSAITGFAATDPVSTPIVSSRSATTAVHVLRGQTTVIGGLLNQLTFEGETKIPILGDIPVLGMLFRSSSKTTTKTELRFYITPRIIEGPRGFKAERIDPIGG